MPLQESDDRPAILFLVGVPHGSAPFEIAASRSAPSGTAHESRVSLKWWHFENNGTYNGAVTLDTTEGTRTSFRTADATRGDTIHIVAEATDEGRLPLTRYARAVVTVE